VCSRKYIQLKEPLEQLLELAAAEWRKKLKKRNADALAELLAGLQ
jgi:hypothetical protein